MNNYLATVHVKGRVFKTLVFAENPLHARYILEFQFGIGTVRINPQPTKASICDAVLDETSKTQVSLSPHQQRIKSLQKQKALISKNIESERAKDKLSKAQKQLRLATQPKTALQ